jgi:hypothetical protein
MVSSMLLSRVILRKYYIDKISHFLKVTSCGLRVAR